MTETSSKTYCYDFYMSWGMNGKTSVIARQWGLLWGLMAMCVCVWGGSTGPGCLALVLDKHSVGGCQRLH